MAGLLLELRRQIYKKHRKGTYSSADPVQESRRPQVYTLDIAGENICERTSGVVNKDDILLRQIDEFKERAQQLQTMLDTRETKAEELQLLVDERQEKADALDQILKERQKKADGITSEVEKQIDSLIAKVGIKMDEIESSVREDLGENNRLSKERAEEMKESLAQIQEQLSLAKSELSEKVHSENVKCYRNIQDLFKSMDEKLDRIEPLEQCAGTAKTCAVVAMVFGIIDFVALVGLILLNLGLFTF